MGTGWALFIEAERRTAADYPHSEFPEPFSWLVDEERRATFEESGNHFESGYHLTLVYLPPEESRARAAGMLYENRPTEGVDWRERLQAFVAETDRVFGLLDGVMPEIAWLDDSQTLTYLHATISTRRYPLAVPEVPFHIDALLTDSALVGGLAPMLGDKHLRVVSVRGFPTSTWPGILDDLNRLGFAYRWSTRFLCLDKAEAEKELARLRRQWFAKRKNVIALLRETIFQQESPLVDTDASNKAADADAALQELGSDQVAFGYLTATVTVLDDDPAAADEKLRMVERVIQGRGFVTIPETLNAVDAWLWPFTDGALYQVYAAIGRVTVIALQPGEELVTVAAGDTVRWIVGDTSSGSGDALRVNVMVKPIRSGLKTNLVITTSRRTYLLELTSTEKTWMASVSWQYPKDRMLALQRQAQAASAAAPIDTGLSLEKIRFRYAISGSTPPWKPLRAFDDGEKVYIQFPAGIAQGELPPLFVIGAQGDGQLVNYRFRAPYYIVDRLFGAAELRLGGNKGDVVRIERNDGAAVGTRRN